MPDVEAIEELLSEIEEIDGVSEAVLVSRSGMYIAGNTPEGAHRETYVAMFAILLGAAETAVSELKESMAEVVIHLDRSKVMVASDGPKAIYVLRLRNDMDTSYIREQLKEFSKRMEKYL